LEKALPEPEDDLEVKKRVWEEKEGLLRKIADSR